MSEPTPVPMYIPQKAETILVALAERKLADAVRVFPSTSRGLTDDIFAVVITCRVEEVLSPDPDPLKSTYRVRSDSDVLTVADEENEGEDAILAGLQDMVQSDDPTGLPLDDVAGFWLIPSASTETNIDEGGRRVRRVTHYWGVTPVAS